MDYTNDNSASGRIDHYMNGIGQSGNWGHDHIWTTGSPSGPFSGHLEDRSGRREQMIRGLGRTALG